MTKAEAVEKIAKECSNYNSCGDCPLYVKGNFTKCAIAVIEAVEAWNRRMAEIARDEK